MMNHERCHYLVCSIILLCLHPFLWMRLLACLRVSVYMCVHVHVCVCVCVCVCVPPQFCKAGADGRTPSQRAAMLAGSLAELCSAGVPLDIESIAAGVVCEAAEAREKQLLNFISLSQPPLLYLLVFCPFLAQPLPAHM